MSVTRLNTYRAREGEEAALKDLLTSILLMVRSMDGCESAYILENLDDPGSFIVAEVWASIEGHQEAVKHLPAETVGQMMRFTDGPTGGAYYAVSGG